MTTPITIPRFGRTVSSLEGKGQQHQPTRMVNFTATAAKLKFRYGYGTIQPSPVSPDQTFSSLGLGFVQNKSGDSEFVGVENRNGTIRPYKYDKGSLAATAIGTEGLAGGHWVISSYGDNAYFINPVSGRDHSVYRYTIHTGTSLVALQDVHHVDAPNSPEINILHSPLGSVAFDTTADTFTITPSNTITSATKAASGSGFTISGNADDNGYHPGMGVLVQVDFAAAKNFSGSDYIALVVKKGPQFDDIKNSEVIPQLKIGGTWTNITSFKEYRSSSGDSMTLVLYVKGLTLTAVQGIKFKPTTTHVSWRDAANRVAFTVDPIYLGGVHLEAVSNTKRLWDSDAGGKSIVYGVRFRDASGTNHSDVFQTTITSDEAIGFRASDYSCGLGGRIYVSTTTSPETPFDRAEILRSTADGVNWKIVNTLTAAPFSSFDPYCEYELGSLTTATDTGSGTVPDPPPVFDTKDIVGAFPFKQFMIWLIARGSENVQMSRVGNAEELYDDKKTYTGVGEEVDLSQPGRRTLADNADDEPVWGTQAGDVAIIIGNKSAYVMSGDFPVQMSPTRQIAGSRGIIGLYAGVRFRSDGGQYAAAYCDPDFNIWVVESAPQFLGDGRGRPTELSLPIRGLLKSFLYSEQRLIHPALDPGQTQLEFDEETSALWVVLGNRAAVYRQDLNESGWEFYSYSLQSDGDVTVNVHTPFTGNGGTASSVSPGNKAFENFGYPFASDDNYCAAGPLAMATGQTTETLRIDGLTPTNLIPATANILGVTYRVERSQFGDFQVSETTVQPRKNLASWGSGLQIPLDLTTSDVTTDFEITSSLPTVAQLNAGQLGMDLRYTQQDVNPAWDVPTNWSITATGPTSIGPLPDTSASLTQRLNVVYTGPGTKPPRVRVAVRSVATTSFGALPAIPIDPYPPFVFGQAKSDNGIGLVLTEDLIMPSHMATVADSTVTYLIDLTGGSGYKDVTASGVTYPRSSDPTGFGISLNFALSGTFVHYVPTTVRIDNVNISVHYSLTSHYSTPWVGWDQVCFTHDGRRVAIRNTGEIDLIEKDFRNGAYIMGPHRDGGFVPPDAEWISQDFSFDGITARFHGVQINTSKPDDNPSAFSKVTGGPWAGGFQTGYSSSRWHRFPLTQRGVQHSIKLSLPEGEGGIESVTLEFDQTSTSKVR